MSLEILLSEKLRASYLFKLASWYVGMVCFIKLLHSNLTTFREQSFARFRNENLLFKCFHINAVRFIYNQKVQKPV